VPYDYGGISSIDYRYSARIHCSLHDTDTTYYIDEMDTVVGRAFLAIDTLDVTGTPPPEDYETGVLDDITENAELYPFITPAATEEQDLAVSAPPVPLTAALAALQPSSGIPPCDEDPATRTPAVCPTQALPAESSLALGTAANGGSYEVAPDARIEVTLPAAYAGNSGLPGLPVISQQISGTTVTIVLKATGLPGGQVLFDGDGVPDWSVAIGVA
jgi:hypothetical protein